MFLEIPTYYQIFAASSPASLYHFKGSIISSAEPLLFKHNSVPTRHLNKAAEDI